jgi:long-chain fatty acid transport protein
MKKNLIRKTLIAFGVILISSSVFATDGYFSLGYGTQSKGFAGAGSAFYETSLIGGNPAGNVFNTKEFNIGVSLFNPNRQYTITGAPSGYPGTFGLAPGTVESDSKFFIMPSLGKNWKLNEKNALTLSFYGNGGMNTNYPTMTFGDTSSPTTGVNLAQMFLDIAYSYKFAEKHSIGVSAIMAMQYFEALGLASFGMMSTDATKLSGNDTDYSYGAGVKIGYMGQIVNGLTLGAQYQSKLSMSEFEEYAGLYAEQGKFDIPSNWTIGLALDVTDNFKILADVKQINYSDSKSVSNPMSNLFAPDGSGALGADAGAGFGWKDMTIYKIGVNCTGLETWTFRAGYSYGKQPISSSEVMFNIVAPGVIENHIGLGASKELNEKGQALHFAFNYALNNSVSGPNPMEAPGQQTIDIEMTQMEFNVSFSF